MKTPKPKPPASQPRRIWRLLNKGENIQEGDEYWIGYLQRWFKAECRGKRAISHLYRRRILVCGYREISK